ncbi:MAG: RecQ family zinc-binding domain-containing protein, partial [Actinobacteria bacterium]|nr:RecQ family zinc-binding domain-containing protein [Actinomycetota bacterium]
HLGAPQSPIAYYQQIGRAGRAVDRADVIMLPGREDAEIWAYFGSLAFPAEAVVRDTLAALTKADRPLSTAALEARVDLSRTRLEMMLKVLDVDGAVRRVQGGWTATGQPWVYDTDRYRRVAAERAREQQAMLSYIGTAGCRMEFLRRELDDPDAQPCGRCDNCTGKHWPAAVPEPAAVAAQDRLLGPGTEIEPRKMWPTGMAELGIDVAGKIRPDQSAEPGRALGRLTDLGWGARLRALLSEENPDADVPDDVVAAVVEVLAGWQWGERPAAIASLPSLSRPQLVGSLARQIAAIGRLPDLGPLALGDQAAADAVGSGRQHNSAQRLRAVWHRHQVPAAMRARLGQLTGPVLLVDDQIITGWTMTIAAMRLREAGTRGVLPFVLATSGT